MKDKRLFICLVLLISSVIMGCKWQVPETVSVRSNADYNFSAGNLKIPLDEYLDIKKIMEKGSLPANVKVYDYFPGQRDPNVQRYLIKAALAEIPLDLDSIMAQIDLEGNLKAMEFNKEFTIPNLSIPSISKSLDTGISGSIPSGTSALDINKSVQFPIDNFLPASAGVESCTIGKGHLDVKVNGITLDEGGTCTFTINSTGGLVINGEAENGGSISLDGATLQTGKTDINVAVNITGLRAVSSPEIVITPVITELGEVTVDVGTDVKTEFKGNEPLPAQFTEIVSAITLKDSGFKVTYTNTLPEGNDVSLTASSVFLGLTEKKETFAGGSVDKTADFMAAGGPLDLTGKSAIDFNVKVGLPGQTETNSSKMTLKGVAMNKTYKLGLKIEPVLEWTDISVNASAIEGFNKKDTVDLGLELNKMLSDLGEKLGNKDLFTQIEIKKLPVYIFCGKPKGIAGLDNLKFDIKEAKMQLVDGSTTTDVGDLLATQDGTGIGFVDELPKLGDPSAVVTQDLDKLPHSVTNDLAGAFTTIIQKPGKLQIAYDVSVTGADTSVDNTITIKKEDLAGNSKIALEAYIDLGLALKIPGKEGIKIDLSKLETFKDVVKPDRDILNGAGKSIKDQGTDAYIKAVKNVAVRCDVTSLPFVTETPINFLMKSNVGDWTLNLGQGHSIDIALTNQQIESLFNNADTNPNCEFKIGTMEVTLPVGDFSIPRGKDVDTNLYLNLATDGTVKVWEKGGEK